VDGPAPDGTGAPGDDPDIREWDVDGSDGDPADLEEPAEQRPVAGDAAPVRRLRLSGVGAIIGALLVVFGFAFVAQINTNERQSQLTASRPEDLVRLLSDLDARKDRLALEINQLQNIQQQLRAGSQGRSAALENAAKRARDLGILAGTMPAQGPGLQVQFVAGAKPLKADVLLDAVEELRGAGAEAMQLTGANGTSVRVVAASWFVDGAGGAVESDGRTLTAPYTLVAIGDPQTMQTAMNIPGGVVDTVHNAGGNVIVSQPGTARVSALHQIAGPRYAQPVS
jgi:uncharacterized protein YlxW (UPF0749 family)